MPARAIVPDETLPCIHRFRGHGLLLQGRWIRHRPLEWSSCCRSGPCPREPSFRSRRFRASTAFGAMGPSYKGGGYAARNRVGCRCLVFPPAPLPRVPPLPQRVPLQARPHDFPWRPAGGRLRRQSRPEHLPWDSRATPTSSRGWRCWRINAAHAPAPHRPRTPARRVPSHGRGRRRRGTGQPPSAVDVDGTRGAGGPAQEERLITGCNRALGRRSALHMSLSRGRTPKCSWPPCPSASRS